MRAANRPQRGFSLLELVVALAIAGTIALIARAVFEATTATTDRLLREAEAQTATWERWITLRELAWHARLTGPDSAPMRGNANRLDFATRCYTGFGWSEPCDAMVEIQHGVVRCVLSTRTSAAMVNYEQSFTEPCTLGFLVDPANGGTWQSQWQLTNALPTAVGIFSRNDTLIIRLGPPL